MTDPRHTDERLRSWLQSQAERERLCLALLGMFGDYRDIRPRRPRGGPDGGRDIEAKLDEHIVWGAVGFQDHAEDSNESRSNAVRKFMADLESAFGENPSLWGFVCFTNVDLPPAMVSDLERRAKARGASHVEVFHRERIRGKLDSTAGLALRLQFLSIPMTVEEQAAFVHHLSASQDARLAEYASVLDAIKSAIVKLELATAATVDTIQAQANRMIAAATGGDSYCAFHFGIDGHPSALIHTGEFPLYDVMVRVCELSRIPDLGATIRFGNMVPGHAVMVGPLLIDWSPGVERRANLFFTARNGSFHQLLRGYLLGSIWIWAWRVMRNGVVLEERIPEELVKQGTSIDWR